MLESLLNIFLNYFQYSLQGQFFLLAGMISFLTGLTVYIKNPRSPITYSFFLFTLSSATWIICFGMVMNVESIKDALYWFRVSYINGVPFIAIWTYLFSCYLNYKKPSKKLIVGGILWGFLLTTWTFMVYDQIVVIKSFSWGRYPIWAQPVPLNFHFIALIGPFSLFTILSFRNFYKGWRIEDNPARRIQLRNIFFAFIITYTGAIDFFAASGIEVYPFGYLSLTLGIVLVAYTVIQHQIFDIKIVFKKITLILFIYILTLAVIFPFVVPFVNKLVKMDIATTFLVLGLSFFIGFIFSLGPLIYANFIRGNFWLRRQSSTGFIHELKSPIGAISGALDIMLMELGKGKVSKEKLREYLRLIASNTDRLESATMNLISIARIQEEDIGVRREMVDINKLLRTVAENKKSELHKNNLYQRFELSNQQMLSLDKEKMELVFSNLFSNAVKFTSVGGITIRTYIKGRNFVCEFIDTGRGISNAEIEKVFDRFYQAQGVSKGSGIGLSISKTWVEAHGGKIWAESEGEGKGTTVTFTLPVNGT